MVVLNWKGPGRGVMASSGGGPDCATAVAVADAGGAGAAALSEGAALGGALAETDGLADGADGSARGGVEQASIETEAARSQ
jgi:hypothetical protein